MGNIILFFLIFAHLWWFESERLEVWVLDWAFGVRGCQLMGSGACGVGTSGLNEVVAVYINIEE